MADVAKLNERFAAGDQQLEPDIVFQLQSIMKMHGLPVQELFYKWEAYCIKMDVPDTRVALTMERLRAFKQDLQDTLVRRNQENMQAGSALGARGNMPMLGAHKKIKAERGAVSATPRNASKADVFGLLDGIMPSTPATGRSRTAGSGPHTGSGKKSGSGRLETPSVSRLRGDHGGSSPDYKTPSSSRLADQLNSPSGGGGGSPSAPPPFRDRPNAGEVVEMFNDTLPAHEPDIVVPYAEARIKLTAASDLKKLAYKPLAMKLSEASEILDDRIDEFTTLVMDHHKIDYEAFGSAASQDTAEIVAVGRIASDSAEGKLNAASVVLETSRRMGGGLRVPLDLTRLKGYHFFPGQIVALRGTNATGSAFVVTQVLELPLLLNAASTPAALAVHRAKLQVGGGGDEMDIDGEGEGRGEGAGGAKDPPPLNIFFASGPYTADDNLDFEPLHTLISVACDKAVDAVVLTGPFLDADHPMIATGDFDLPDDAVVEPDAATMATVFRYMISPALQRLASAHPAVTILLVPSVRDVVDKHVSWPQDAFSRKELGLPKTTRIVGNPMTLAMNEMVLGISSQDILYELRHEELVAGRVSDTNAVSRACRYLLEQRHYFPLYPPVDRRRLPKTGVEEGGAAGLATGSMLDTSYLKLGEMINVRPDVLVTPSALPPFVKVVESVMMINPGYLSKRRGAGTYVRMTLYPPEVGGEDGSMIGHKIFDRARVEIRRI